MTPDVADHFAAAGGMADVNRVAQIELPDKLGKVVGISIHVVALPGLSGPAVAAPVMAMTR